MERLIRPYIHFSEVEAELRDIFDSGIFTKGKYVEQFRESIRTYTGAKYSFLTTSATTALWVSLKAIGIHAGDEVIVSDFSFPASANVIEDLGAVPVFADVNLDTFNMLPEELERKITQRTKAVMFVDALGNPSGLLAIRDICRKHGLVLIEDAACAFGSSIEGVPCGKIADITCFSFHPRKLLTTGEGGAITTDNPEYARFFDVKLNHGAVFENGIFDFVDYGYNFRLSEIQAALGVKQVAKIDAIIASRSQIRGSYVDRLSKTGFKPQAFDHNVRHNIQSVVFLVPSDFSRNDLMLHLRQKSIESTLGTYCLSGTSYYKNKYMRLQANAHYLQNNTITLPCYDQVNIANVCSAIDGYAAVRRSGSER